VAIQLVLQQRVPPLVLDAPGPSTTIAATTYAATAADQELTSMSGSFNLSLPLDIPWKRICVTKDMMDPVVCDSRLPPKWQSSIAVFKYTPTDDYQLYPDYKISYLKVTVTLTGYQPLDQEIQGSIDWNGVNVETIDGLTELLNSYNPCHGAIIQVVVGPHKSDKEHIERYPFFLDFEPKKRELYEMATDTKERQSRCAPKTQVRWPQA
jgi:hypothetical protein